MHKALEVMKQMKATGTSWVDILQRMEQEFGVRLTKDQVKALVR